MKVTKKNYKDIVPEKEQEMINSLLNDLDDINKYHKEDKLYIDWQDYHDEYSCERTDPCPDFYGYYRLKFDSMQYESIGDTMTINELDNALCILFSYNYLQNMGSEINDSIVV